MIINAPSNPAAQFSPIIPLELDGEGQNVDGFFTAMTVINVYPIEYRTNPIQKEMQFNFESIKTFCITDQNCSRST